MYAWFYRENTLLMLPVLAMLVFMAVFLGALVRALFGRQPPAALTGLPLEPERLAPASKTGGKQ